MEDVGITWGQWQESAPGQVRGGGSQGPGKGWPRLDVETATHEE